MSGFPDERKRNPAGAGGIRPGVNATEGTEYRGDEHPHIKEWYAAGAESVEEKMHPIRRRRQLTRS